MALLQCVILITTYKPKRKQTDETARDGKDDGKKEKDKEKEEAKARPAKNNKPRKRKKRETFNRVIQKAFHAHTDDDDVGDSSHNRIHRARLWFRDIVCYRRSPKLTIRPNAANY